MADASCINPCISHTITRLEINALENTEDTSVKLLLSVALPSAVSARILRNTNTRPALKVTFYNLIKILTLTCQY